LAPVSLTKDKQKAAFAPLSADQLKSSRLEKMCVFLSYFSRKRSEARSLHKYTLSHAMTIVMANWLLIKINHSWRDRFFFPPSPTPLAHASHISFIYT